ncbi:hypothetical protein CORT_0D07140 [Candida orthopsilosis Co 90-125]|uniref:Uncharacterized protein n=1 Tax=Candida orthopsilosis (strain 90-125) TaxID=1136231 RepID=H8X5T9_CANO9|nr:hypothetical protein CORT_0D07140 [Candida orthopsilosis Co 90-125]CCG23547.1 hypothetical protein CORT_0D07140 [Candida orthopsilosis Co 90-125]
MVDASLILIVLGTLFTGAANSLLTKYQDNQCVHDCDSNHPQYFNQPGIQTLQMFLGELSMFFVYLGYKWYYWTPYIQLGGEEERSDEGVAIFKHWKLAIPAICDLSCTTLLNVGLIYVPVSIYQMTRGSVVLFVAVLSVIFLNRRISKLHWIALFVITLGVGIVGLSGSQTKTAESATSGAGLIVFGIILIIGATSLQGVQFVVEEHILAKQPIIPLQLVYIEGFFGATTITLFMVVLNFISKSIQSPEEFARSPFNIVEAFSQVFGNRTVLVTSLLIMASIASFNFCGLSITHRISATARSTVDTCRTLIVWLFAVVVMQWERFKFLQMTGFAILVFGTLWFNGVIEVENWSFIPSWLKDEDENEDERTSIDEALEERLIS